MRRFSHGKGPRRILAIIGSGLVLGACSSRGGVPNPATEQGEDVLHLWRILLASGVALGALVAGLILWTVAFHRRPRDAAPDALPRQTRANVPLEVFYTVVPLAIVAVLFGLTLRTQHRVTRVSATPDVAVEVTGFQWGWQFRYPAQGVTVVGDANKPPTLVLPVGATVRLHLVASDVIHSFFVPQFLVKRDLIPGVDNSLELRPTQTGHFAGYCAEFCGLDHSRMLFFVDVVTPEQFQGFAATQQTAPGGPGPDSNGPGDVGRQARIAVR